MITYKTMNDEGLKPKKPITDDMTVLDVIRRLITLKAKDYDTDIFFTSSKFLEDEILDGLVSKEKGQVRREIAVLNTEDTNTIELNNGIGNFNILDKLGSNSLSVSSIEKRAASDIVKLNIDASNQILYSTLFRKGIISKKENRVKSSTYGTIFNIEDIKKEDLRGILFPLQADMLYAINPNNMLKDSEVTYLVRMVLNNIVVDDYLDDRQKLFYRELYVNNKTISTILYEIMEQNHIYADVYNQRDFSMIDPVNYESALVFDNKSKNIEILSIIEYIINMKRSIITALINGNLKELGITIDEALVPEDHLVFTKRDTVMQFDDAILNYNGFPIVIEAKRFKEERDRRSTLIASTYYGKLTDNDMSRKTL